MDILYQSLLVAQLDILYQSFIYFFFLIVIGHGRLFEFWLYALAASKTDVKILRRHIIEAETKGMSIERINTWVDKYGDRFHYWCCVEMYNYNRKHGNQMFFYTFVSEWNGSSRADIRRKSRLKLGVSDHQFDERRDAAITRYRNILISTVLD